MTELDKLGHTGGGDLPVATEEADQPSWARCPRGLDRDPAAGIRHGQSISPRVQIVDTRVTVASRTADNPELAVAERRTVRVRATCTTTSTEDRSDRTRSDPAAGLR